MTASPVRQFMRKIFMVLPITFMFAPVFYAFLGYRPDMPLFFALVYLWHALFVFLGVALAFVFKKYKYLAYILILAIAFLCRDAVSVLEPDSQRSAAELIYFAYVLFASSAVSGACGVFYSRKEPLDFLSKNNTFLFCNIFAISALYYIFGGILETDKNAGFVFAFFLTGFAASYFIVRNFAYIDREIGIYGKMGAYNISGTNRVYAYYFSVLAILSIVPVFVGVVLVPFILNTLGSAAGYIMARLLKAVLGSEVESQVLEEPVLDPYGSMGVSQGAGDKMLAYYILVVAVLTIVLVLIVIFRKNIIKAIKELILFLKTRMTPDDHARGVVIERETITQTAREKKEKPSYRNYLKKAKKIKDLQAKFLFAYRYVFWNTVKKDKDLKISATPSELAEKYSDTKNPANLYSNIIYGQKPAESGEMLIETTAEAEVFIQKFL